MCVGCGAPAGNEDITGSIILDDNNSFPVAPCLRGGKGVGLGLFGFLWGFLPPREGCSGEPYSSVFHDRSVRVSNIILLKNELLDRQ